MDIGLFIIVLIVMYVVPEIMKRLKPKKPYQYPEFPSPLPSDRQGPLGIPGEISKGTTPPPVSEMSGEGMPGDEGDPNWVMHEEQIIPEAKGFAGDLLVGLSWGAREAVQGFIWAEIIAPPVSLRPMRHGIRRV